MTEQMKTGIEQTREIMAAIPGAATRWPEWFWPYCPDCDGNGCDKSLDYFGNVVLTCWKCKCDVLAPDYRFDPDTESGSPMMIIGGDLSDPRNLWALLMVADCVYGSQATVNTLMNDAEGSNRTTALLAALRETLGLGVRV